MSSKFEVQMNFDLCFVVVIVVVVVVVVGEIFSVKNRDFSKKMVDQT